MPSNEQLLVRIDAVNDGLKRTLSQSDQHIAAFESKTKRSLAGIDASFSGLGAGLSKINGLLGALGIGASLGALAGLGRDALNLADNIGDTAAQLGIGTTALQVYRFAAHDLGVEQATLEGAIKKVQTAIGDAAAGSEADRKKFAALGIDFVDAAGNARSFESVMLDLADRIKGLATPAEKASAAAVLMGERMGPGMVPLLNQGADAIRNYGNEADKAGQLMGEVTVERLGKAQDAIENFKNRAVIAAAEILNATANLFDVDGVESARKELKTVTGEIEQWQRNLEAVKEGGVMASIAEMFGTEEEPLKRINALLQRRNELLGIIGGPRVKDDAVQPPGKPGAGGGIDLSNDSANHAKSIREVTSAIDAQLVSLRQQIDLTAIEGRARLELTAIFRAQQAAQQDYQNGLRDSPILTEAEIEAVQRLTGAISTLEEAKQAAADAERARKAAEKDATKEAEEATRAWSAGFGALENSATSALDAILEGTFNVRGALAGLLRDLAKVALNAAFSGLASGAGGILGSLFGGGLPIMGGSALGAVPGARAGGGPVQRGRPYIVGERRAELFVPDVSGDIIPSVPRFHMPDLSAAAERAGRATVINIGTVAPHVEIKVSGNIGEPAQNADLVQQMAKAARAQFDSMMDARINFNQRGGGAFRPNVVG